MALTSDTLVIVAADLPKKFPNTSIEIIGEIRSVPRIDWVSSSNISLGAAATIVVNVVPNGVVRFRFRFFFYRCRWNETH